MRSVFIKLSFLLFLIGLCTQSFALDIQKGLYEREESSRPGIRIYLDVQVSAVKDAYEDYIKKELGFKLKGNGWFTNKDELYAENVEAKEIIDKQVNWYAQIIPVPGNEQKTQMTIFVSLGYDIYVNETEYPEAFQGVYETSIAFLTQFVPEYHEELIQETTNLVKELADDTSDLGKEISRHQKKIETLRKEIRAMEAEREEKLHRLDLQRAVLQNRKEIFRDAQKELKEIN